MPTLNLTPAATSPAGRFLPLPDGCELAEGIRGTLMLIVHLPATTQPVIAVEVHPDLWDDELPHLVLTYVRRKVSARRQLQIVL